MDDPAYVSANSHVQSGLSWAGVRYAFTTFDKGFWHPLTWLSLMLDRSLFGPGAWGFHLTSLLLHAANTLLLFVVLRRMTGATWRSATVAAVFGLHPLHVESVAWIAERKDVLSTMFGLLALLAYTAYSRRPGISRYLLMAALFAGSLLSKPMLVTLPVLLLLVDWWPLQRKFTRWVVLEKLPLLLLGGLASGAAIWAHGRSASITTLDELPLALRLSNAAVSYVRYLWKTVWPTDLAVFYPFPLGGIPLWMTAAGVLAMAAITWLVFLARRQRPWLVFGWCWYVITLLP